MSTRKKNDSIGATKLTETQKEILKQAGKKYTVRTDEGEQSASLVELAFRQIAKTALGGSPHAQRHMMELITDAQNAQFREIEDNVARGKAMKAHFAAKREAAIERGEDPESVLPHPDDIHIEEGVGFSIRGPFDDDSLAAVRNICDMREALLLQAVLEERMPSAIDAVMPTASTPFLLAVILNDKLPHRFQSTDVEMELRLSKFQRGTKRELLRDCHQTWKTLGADAPRGFVFPARDAFLKLYKIYNLGHEFLVQQQTAGIAVSVEELSQEILLIQQQLE